MGNTGSTPGVVPSFQDHPHVCGEYSTKPASNATSTGSPPRVWGILPHVVPHHVAHRITPTCVGNTTWTRCARGTARDHPHVCGEYVTCNPPKPALMGSPPRVWGIPGLSALSAGTHRITPTCVGNTLDNPQNSAILKLEFQKFHLVESLVPVSLVHRTLHHEDGYS